MSTIVLAEQATPSTPSVGTSILYPKADGLWYFKDDAGVEHRLDIAAIPKSLIDAKGDLIVGSAADTAVRLAVGANGLALVADSAEVSGVKWVAIPGGLVPINRQVASASANIDFTTGIDATHDEYLVTLTNIVPASDGSRVLVRVSQDGGSTFKAAAGDYAHAEETANGGGTGGETGGTSATAVQIAAAGISNAAASGGLSGEVRFFAPSSTAVHKHFTWACVTSNATTFYSMQGGGRFDLNTDAINAIRFVMDSGNITSGIFALYGLKKS